MAKIISITIDEELLNEIDKTANTLHMNRSAYISMILSTTNGNASATDLLKQVWTSAVRNEKTKDDALAAFA